MYLCFKGSEDMELTKDLEDIGFEVTYHSTWKEYNVRLDTYEQFEGHRDLFCKYSPISAPLRMHTVRFRRQGTGEKTRSSS